ncbi:MAG: hypothetical protein ACLQB4_00140 [Beijerinckiaceae bacterium]
MIIDPVSDGGFVDAPVNAADGASRWCRPNPIRYVAQGAFLSDNGSKINGRADERRLA